MSRRVLLGSGKETILKQLSQFLFENGFTVVGQASDGYDYLRQVHTFYPDLCIVDFNMRGMNGHEVAEVLVSDRLAPVIVLMNPSETHHFVNLRQDAYFAEMVKPINRHVLVQTMDLLVKSALNIQKLEAELQQLKRKIDDKTIIDKAKRLLMKNLNITEEQAHRKIQKESMDRGVSKIKVANTIIFTYTE